MNEGFCPLASGSKGNCTYIASQRTKILIDAGISAKAVNEHLEAIGVELEEIDAILVSHEHTDHIAGLKTLALKMGIPVLANRETANGIVAVLQECPRFKIFSTGENFTFGDIQIHPFTVQHDTLDPVAFTLQIDGLKVGVCTDLGFATTLVKSRLAACDYLMIEANHEPSMVHACSRPAIYKQRVLSRSGHLSNEACADLLSSLVHPQLKKIYLAHLSSECNTPIVALKRVHEKIGKEAPVTIALQDQRAEAVCFR